MVRILPLALAAPLALAGCTGEERTPDALAALALELAEAEGSGDADAAIRSALSGPILSDPMLVASANLDAVRPPTRPVDGALPRIDVASGGAALAQLAPDAPDAVAADDACVACQASRRAITLEALAARLPDARAQCLATLRYSARWAQRLPAATPLVPDARIVEAAGSDAGSCALRTVAFASTLAPDALVDWYHAQAAKGGYRVTLRRDGDQRILDAQRAADNARAVLFLNPDDSGGTAVDIVASRG